MGLIEILRCPVCGAPTEKRQNSLYCCGARVHCFDFAKEGYLHLADAKAAGGGDDATLIAARTAFLSAGHYAPFAARIIALLDTYAKGKTVIDAGCGEGYYAQAMAQAGYTVLGIDLSKRGVRAAAKAAGREGLTALFAVAGIYTLPVFSESVDAVVSLFAPIGEEEFLRVLKPGGIFICAGAGAKHLIDLKRVLYDTPRENEARADLPVTMRTLHTETLDFTMHLPQAALSSLFAMTPYYYRTSKEGVARLAATEALDVLAQMDIHVYQKGE